MAANCSSVSETGRPEAVIAASKAALSQGLPFGVGGVGSTGAAAAGAGAGLAAGAAGAMAGAGGVALSAKAGAAAQAARPAINPRRLSVSEMESKQTVLQ